MSPSEFYKKLRPEYFSDSDISFQNTLPKEHLAYELNQISTNQKQDEFESLCRRLAEKFIAPNLIPQVGPTGGGDGKTDSETYPVSDFISERWFIPENGWDNNEKWAFAISAKQAWKGKLKNDIINIVSTKRDYTRIYFMSNQTVSSKKKKDAQDEFIKEFKVDVIILDAEWILEKIYNSSLIDLAVDSLNLSDVYKNKITSVGHNDSKRLRRLEEIEKRIENPKRYFEYDFQLVEDALESAKLSRMLEKSRDEVEGKFDRAVRFNTKVNNNKLWIRIHYQRAWTYIHWYDDYAGFISEFVFFKSHIKKDSSIEDLELYNNLINVLRGVSLNVGVDFKKFNFDVVQEVEDFLSILKYTANIIEKPCSALIAKTYLGIQDLMAPDRNKDNINEILVLLSDCLTKSISFLDYPFESICKLIDIFGEMLAANPLYDDLVDTIALLSEKRSSELAAGEIFIRRGGQKMAVKLYSESIIYFGKAVMKLAKEESKYGMYLSLIGLSYAYEKLGLVWASNNCLVTAASISIRPLYEEGRVDMKMFQCIKKLIDSEVMIGRIPVFLVWHELLSVLSQYINNQDEEDFKAGVLTDGCLAVRFIHTDYKDLKSLSLLPDLLESQNLLLSQSTVLYSLGYINEVLEVLEDTNLKDEAALDKHFQLLAMQPFTKQIIFETDFLDSCSNKISTRILGCLFYVYYPDDKELHMAAETILAFFESFLATSLKDIHPISEQITIQLIKNDKATFLNFHQSGSSSNNYTVEVNKFDFKGNSEYDIFREQILELSANILSKNFVILNAQDFLENLFKKEEVHERILMVGEHRKFLINILGDDPKLFFNDWIRNKSFKQYPLIRKMNLVLDKDLDEDVASSLSKPDFEKAMHSNRRVSSIIDVNLWNEAKWKVFGFFADNEGMGVILAFENGEKGKQIFDNWIEIFGKEDKTGTIRIAVIKGINKDNPSWYTVHISKDLDLEEMKEGNFFMSTSRFNEMRPQTSVNLDNLLTGWNMFKKFRLVPAQLLEHGKIEPFFDKAIIKHHLIIKNAWEIGEHDIDRSVIKSISNPIIPENEVNAPVLKLLNIK